MLFPKDSMRAVSVACNVTFFVTGSAECFICKSSIMDSTAELPLREPPELFVRRPCPLSVLGLLLRLVEDLSPPRERERERKTLSTWCISVAANTANVPPVATVATSTIDALTAAIAGATLETLPQLEVALRQVHSCGPAASTPSIHQSTTAPPRHAPPARPEHGRRRWRCGGGLAPRAVRRQPRCQPTRPAGYVWMVQGARDLSRPASALAR